MSLADFRQPLKSEVVTVPTAGAKLTALMAGNKMDSSVHRITVQNLDASAPIFFSWGTGSVPATAVMGQIAALAEKTFEFQETYYTNLNFRAVTATRAMFVTQEGHR